MEGDEAVLRSPVIPSSTKLCLSFYYHMYGSTMGRLDILTADRANARYTAFTINIFEEDNSS